MAKSSSASVRMQEWVKPLLALCFVGSLAWSVRPCVASVPWSEAIVVDADERDASTVRASAGLPSYAWLSHGFAVEWQGANHGALAHSASLSGANEASIYQLAKISGFGNVSRGQRPRFAIGAWTIFTPRKAGSPPGDALHVEPRDSFGSVDVPIRQVAHSGAWRRATTGDGVGYLNGDCEASDPVCSVETSERLRKALRHARGLERRDQLDFVNRAVNSIISYRSDARLYGRADHWATFEEIVTRGAGDCEDIALAKMWMLRALGFAPEAMRLVLLRETRRGLDHAVLVVRYGNENLVLDNLLRDVRRDSDLPSYRPVISLAHNGFWLHGERRVTQGHDIASNKRPDSTKRVAQLR